MMESKRGDQRALRLSEGPTRKRSLQFICGATVLLALTWIAVPMPLHLMWFALAWAAAHTALIEYYYRTGRDYRFLGLFLPSLASVVFGSEHINSLSDGIYLIHIVCLYVIGMFSLSMWCGYRSETCDSSGKA